MIGILIYGLAAQSGSSFLIDMLISSPNLSPSFLSIIPIQGEFRHLTFDGLMSR